MQHRPGFFRPWVQGVGSILENICKIQCCAGLRHNSFPPACQGFGYHEYISNTVADIHGICFFRMARFTGDAGFLYKLFVRFIYTDHRTEGVVWALVYLRHVLHLRHEFGFCFRNAPFLCEPRLDFVFS